METHRGRRLSRSKWHQHILPDRITAFFNKFLFGGVFAHRVGKPPTHGGGGPRSGGEGGLQL